jgi:hypothetical protein
MEYISKGRHVLARPGKGRRWEKKFTAKTAKRAQKLAELCSATQLREEKPLIDEITSVDPNAKNQVVAKINPVITAARQIVLANAALNFNEDVKLYLTEQLSTLTEQEQVSVLKVLDDIKKQNEEILRYLRKLTKR